MVVWIQHVYTISIYIPYRSAIIIVTIPIFHWYSIVKNHVLAIKKPQFPHAFPMVLPPGWCTNPRRPGGCCGALLGQSQRGQRAAGGVTVLERRGNRLPCRLSDGEVLGGELLIWVNCNISGWFPLLTMIPVRSQWGRYNLPRLISGNMIK